MSNIHQKLIERIYSKYMISGTWDRSQRAEELQVEGNVQEGSCIILTSTRNHCRVSSDTISKV